MAAARTDGDVSDRSRQLGEPVLQCRDVPGPDRTDRRGPHRVVVAGQERDDPGQVPRGDDLAALGRPGKGIEQGGPPRTGQRPIGQHEVQHRGQVVGASQCRDQGLHASSWAAGTFPAWSRARSGLTVSGELTALRAKTSRSGWPPKSNRPA